MSSDRSLKLPAAGRRRRQPSDHRGQALSTCRRPHCPGGGSFGPIEKVFPRGVHQRRLCQVKDHRRLAAVTRSRSWPQQHRRFMVGRMTKIRSITSPWVASHLLHAAARRSRSRSPGSCGHCMCFYFFRFSAERAHSGLSDRPRAEPVGGGADHSCRCTTSRLRRRTRRGSV